MRRTLLSILALALSLGCAHVVIEPGHRGLLFDPDQGGLHREVLTPGYYSLSHSARMIDFDVTFSTDHESVRALSADDATTKIEVDVIYRPIIAELYELETEIGPRYYTEVVSPEARSVALDVVAHHPCLDLLRKSEAVEDEIEMQLRARLKGRHIEIASVVLVNVDLGAKCMANLPPPKCVDN